MEDLVPGGPHTHPPPPPIPSPSPCSAARTQEAPATGLAD